MKFTYEFHQNFFGITNNATLETIGKQNFSRKQAGRQQETDTERYTKKQRMNEHEEMGKGVKFNMSANRAAFCLSKVPLPL